MKRWRILDYGTHWYLAICPDCHLPGGWRTRDHCQRSIIEMDAVRSREAVPVQYEAGEDETCGCAPEPAPVGSGPDDG